MTNPLASAASRVIQQLPRRVDHQLPGLRLRKPDRPPQGLCHGLPRRPRRGAPVPQRRQGDHRRDLLEPLSTLTLRQYRVGQVASAACGMRAPDEACCDSNGLSHSYN